MGSYRKGKAWELEVVRLIQDATGVNCERNLGDAFGRGNSGDVQTQLPLTIQAKVGKQPSLWRALKEAQEASEGTGEYPVAMVRRNASHSSKKPEDVAVMALEDFAELLSQLKACGAW